MIIGNKASGVVTDAAGSSSSFQASVRFRSSPPVMEAMTMVVTTTQNSTLTGDFGLVVVKTLYVPSVLGVLKECWVARLPPARVMRYMKPVDYY